MKLQTKLFIGAIVMLLGIILYGYFQISNLKATIQEYFIRLPTDTFASISDNKI